jgi:lipopolysaccharide export system protein LptC
MINPRYSGLDSQNQPYSISAKKAFQPAEKLVELEDVTADITLKNGNWLSLVAPNGTYAIEEQYLTLPAAYDLFITEPSAKTYQASGTSLSVDAKNSIAKSTKKFMAESEQFVLTSQNGFTFYKAESRILFHGRVNLVIYKK